MISGLISFWIYMRLRVFLLGIIRHLVSFLATPITAPAMLADGSYHEISVQEQIVLSPLLIFLLRKKCDNDYRVTL
jgi:hypothetical protein